MSFFFPFPFLFYCRLGYRQPWLGFVHLEEAMLCFQQLKALAIVSVTMFERVTSRPGYRLPPEDEDEDQDTDQDDTHDSDGVLILLFDFSKCFRRGPVQTKSLRFNT
jgi:hypothetical protein